VDPGSLDRLHGIVAAQSPGWWPLAPGWLVVGGVLFALALWLAVRAFVRWRADAYRRAALAELASASTVVEIATLLKRTALSVFERREVAGLSGAAWLAFLDRSGGTTAFTRGPGARLPELCYDPKAAAALAASELAHLRAVVGDWIRHHEAPR
jgi:hypothetical protein